MGVRLAVLLFACMASVVAGCSQQEWVEGGLYSVESENGGYSIVKILKLDPEGVHVRLYSNHFSKRPSDVDPANLYMAGIDHRPEENLGLGHLPLSRTSFEGWRAVLIKVVAVEADELDGYDTWKEAGGGYF